MSTEFNTDDGVSVNREVKDELFRFIFIAPENKPHLLSLYNALSGKSYTNPDDLIITTLEDAIFINMKNDLSFLIDGEMSLFEHQSTYNPNMPLRGFLYFAHLYDSYLTSINKDLYGNTLVKIPSPRYIVFYNGLDKNIPDEVDLHLSDAFTGDNDNGNFEWTAKILNINNGHNEKLMKQCAALSEYSQFIADFRIKLHSGVPKEEAAIYAVDNAIRRPTLGKFFLKMKGDAYSMLLTKYVSNEEYEARRYEEGVAEGESKGYDLMVEVVTKLRKGENEADLRKEYPNELVDKALILK
jgi:hypothetical protein